MQTANQALVAVDELRAAVNEANQNAAAAAAAAEAAAEAAQAAADKADRIFQKGMRK